MTVPDYTDVELLADEGFYSLGNGAWLATRSWVANISLGLPQRWLEAARAPRTGIKAPLLSVYLDAARNAPRGVRFNPPTSPRSHPDEWRHSVKGSHGRHNIDAHLKAYFEALTPGSHWRLATDPEGMTYHHRPVTSGAHLFARVHPTWGVRVVIAGRVR